MSKVELRPAVVEERKVQMTTKQPLYGEKCDCCGSVFVMDEFCNDRNLAVLHGTFDSAGKDGNGFLSTCCSFQCAYKLFELEGWKKLPQWQHFVEAGAKLVRAELQLTVFKLDEKAAIDRWTSNYEEKGIRVMEGRFVCPKDF
jgi:hypothetical protein